MTGGGPERGGSERGRRPEAGLERLLRAATFYRWRSERSRAASDLRSTFRRADPGHRAGVANAARGGLLALAGVAVINPADDFTAWRVLFGTALTVIGGRDAWVAFKAAWKSLDPLKQPDEQFYYLCEKLPALEVNGRPCAFHEIAPEPSDLPDLRVARSGLGGGAAQRSAAFDEALVAADRIAAREGPDRTGSYISSDAEKRRDQLDYLRHRVGEKGRTTDDAKFGVAVAPRLPLEPVELYRIGYYDALATNEAFRSGIARRRRGTGRRTEPAGPVRRLDRHFPVEADPPRLVPMALRRTADHVGVTVLAITSDGYPLLFRQAEDSAINAGCAVAAGSGSVDWDDIAAAEDRGDLKSILRHTAARELQQEMLPASGAENGRAAAARRARYAGRDRTMLTGFFRWVDRGGKPEFVGLARVDERLDELCPNPAELVPLDIPLPRLSSMRDLARVEEGLRGWVAGDPAGRAVALSTAVAVRRAAEIGAMRPGDPTYDQAERLLAPGMADWRS